MAYAILAILFVIFVTLMAVPIWITYKGGEEILLRDILPDEDA